MRGIVVFTILAGLAGLPVLAQPQLTLCDRLAGYDHTPRLPGLPGVATITDPAGAIAACEQAVQAEGADPFLRFLLARAYETADPADARIALLIESTREAYPIFADSRLARLHAEGLGGLPHDSTLGEALARRACDSAPDPQALAACNNLGLQGLRGGDGQTRAATLLQTTCEQGFAIACLNLAFALSEGGALAPDSARATGLFVEACELGWVEVCHYAGYALAMGDEVPQDLPRAADFQGRSCSAGTAEACHSLARMEVWGDGIPRNWQGGMERLAGACAAGVHDACYDRGLEQTYGIDAGGDVTPEGQSEAVAEFRRLCAQDHARSCTEMGFLYQAGLSLTQDSGLALGFNSRGCDLGDRIGCNNLGAHYAQGLGVERDLRRAAGYFRQACDSGSGLGCANLADLVEGDALGAPDAAAAQALRGLACENGHDAACR